MLVNKTLLDQVFTSFRAEMEEALSTVTTELLEENEKLIRAHAELQKQYVGVITRLSALEAREIKREQELKNLAGKLTEEPKKKGESLFSWRRQDKEPEPTIA